VKQKKILHIIKGLGRGGAERLLVSTIRQHSKHYAFDVVYFLPEKNHLQKDLESLGCTVTCLSSSNVLSMVSQLPALVKIIRANHYDILHAHLPWAGIVARLAGKITGVKVVYTEHNLFNRYNVVTRVISKLTFGWQHMVIAVSDKVKEVLEREVNPTVPVRVVNNGVDVEEFSVTGFRLPVVGRVEEMEGVEVGSTEPSVLGHDKSNQADPSVLRTPPLKGEENKNKIKNKIVIGTVTALTEQKRIDRWIRIAEKVAAKIPECAFVIVGDGVLQDDVHAWAKALVEQKKLVLPGQTNDPVSWLAHIDIFLMSSDFEGLPVSLLEAMAMECVPVVTNVGGIPAVVEQGVNGYMVETEQEEEAVLNIVTLAQDEVLRKRMGTAARKTVVEKYSVTRMVGELEEVYASLK
jgi:L-malate glycosyltransferase